MRKPQPSTAVCAGRRWWWHGSDRGDGLVPPVAVVEPAAGVSPQRLACELGRQAESPWEPEAECFPLERSGASQNHAGKSVAKNLDTTDVVVDGLSSPTPAALVFSASHPTPETQSWFSQRLLRPGLSCSALRVGFSAVAGTTALPPSKREKSTRWGLDSAARFTSTQPRAAARGWHNREQRYVDPTRCVRVLPASGTASRLV